MSSKDLPPSPAAGGGGAPAQSWIVRHAAVFIAALYVAMGLGWISVSDWIAMRMLGPGPDVADELTRLQTFKGCLFIVLTGVMLYFLVAHNVRAMRRAQAEMRKRLEGIAKQYQMLFQDSPCAMMIYEPVTTRIRAVNDCALLMLGYSREELLAMSAFDLLVEEERARAEVTAHNPQGGIRNDGVWQCRRRDRRIIFVETITHQLDFDGAHAGISLMTDVTERLRTERSLAQHRSQLEQRVADRTTELSLANKKLRGEVDERHRVEADLRAATAVAESASTAKSTFLANTSHEIRTPLTSILGYADLLADSALPEAERNRYLEVVRQNAQHLLALIDDLLDLSRAEMGKVRLVFNDHSPREIAQHAVELLRPRAQDKQLELELRFDGRIPPTIRTDGMRVRQILLNLLSNAVKFTSRGQVTLTLRGPAPLDDAADDTPIQFEVADSGIGMAPLDMGRVFEPFYQVDQGATRRFGGSGLGLAISQQLAMQMGGSLSVQSTLGEGSIFTLSLPSPIDDAPAAPAQSAPAGPRQLTGTILLAEDNTNIRHLVEEFLRRAGAQVISTSDGAQAVQHVQAALAAGAPAIDLVLLDLHMPVLDGAAAHRRMRLAGYSGPIVGLTADYAEKSLDEWSRDGWDAMAAKPIDREAFIPLLARLMAEWAKRAVR